MAIMIQTPETVERGIWPSGWREMAARACDDESGVTAIEYGLLAALIAVVCLVAFGNYAAALGNLFNNWVIPALNSL